jgi:hypothetical protein
MLTNAKCFTHLTGKLRLFYFFCDCTQRFLRLDGEILAELDWYSFDIKVATTQPFGVLL